jgi:hypothetical protein
MSVRAAFVDQLVDIAGPDVHVIGYETNRDEIDRITVMVKQRTITRLPAAANGALRIDYVLTITAPETDAERAETRLDDFVPAFLADLSPYAWIAWTAANKKIDGNNLCYDVDVYVLGTPAGDSQTNADASALPEGK